MEWDYAVAAAAKDADAFADLIDPFSQPADRRAEPAPSNREGRRAARRAAASSRR
jgi:hypothetical protein